MIKKDKVEYIDEQDSDLVDSKLKKTKKKFRACEKERADYLAGWQRAKADLINYKKEQEQKNSDIFKFANEIIIGEILPVLDSFEEAMKHDKNEGIKQLCNQLKGILKNNGIEEIEAVGEKFNPEFHESVGEIKKGKTGFVVEEVQKGYKLNNKVIRPSRVKISK